MIEKKAFIKNSKGLKLASIIHRPEKEGKFPAIIILHGFTGYKEEAHLQVLADALAKNGFVAVRFDCSGSGDSDGTFEKDYLVSNYLKDIKCVYDYVRGLKFVDENRIGIAGHSMGGMLSVIFASQQPEIKACVAVSATTTMRAANCIKDVIDEWQKTGWFDKECSKDGSQIKIPYSFMEDADKHNALDYVKKLNCPLLVIFGTSDDVVLPENTKEIFIAANEPKNLAEIKGMGHDYKNNPELMNMVNEKALYFLRKYL